MPTKHKPNTTQLNRILSEAKSRRTKEINALSKRAYSEVNSKYETRMVQIRSTILRRISKAIGNLSYAKLNADPDYLSRHIDNRISYGLLVKITPEHDAQLARCIAANKAISRVSIDMRNDVDREYASHSLALATGRLTPEIVEQIEAFITTRHEKLHYYVGRSGHVVRINGTTSP